MKKVAGLIVALGLTVGLSHYTFAADPTVDELLNLILSSTGTVSTPATGTEEVITVAAVPAETTPAPTAPVVATPVLQPAGDEEFVSALSWMYTNGLTQFSTPSSYEPSLTLTRQQAAKFFVVMQENVIGQVPVQAIGGCVFTDTGFDASLRSFVDKACAYGILVGNNGSFRPNAKISKPEFVTALVRMIEGSKRDETGNPRWSQYYQQARDRGLTKERNANAFDVALSRYEAALFLYRSLAVLRQNNTIVSTDTGTTTTPTGTGTSGDTSGLDNTSPLTSLVADPALQEAIYWMHDNNMTKFASVEQYRPFDTLTRQEGAKIFVLFRNLTIQGTPTETSATSCAFDDLNIADQTLVSYIKQACKMQIIKGSNNLFSPEGFLTKPQAIAILVRMIEGPQVETGAIRWQGYYDRALALGMIEPAQAANFDKPISRYEIAKILYNSKVKYEIIKNLNNNFETNKLMYPVPGTLQTGANTGESTSLVSINTQILQRNDIDTYVVDLLGNQYKIERQATQKYLNNDYVRYGKMLLIDESQSIGSAVFTLSNGVIIDGVLRPYGAEMANYFVKPSQQQPYYEMTKKLK